MKLKGLVWFFAITLVVISLYQLSFTWVVNSFEKQLKQKAQRYVAINYPNVTGDDKDAMVKAELLHIMDSNRDTKIYPIFGTTYLKCKENELNLCNKNNTQTLHLYQIQSELQSRMQQTGATHHYELQLETTSLFQPFHHGQSLCPVLVLEAQEVLPQLEE